MGWLHLITKPRRALKKMFYDSKKTRKNNIVVVNSSSNNTPEGGGLHGHSRNKSDVALDKEALLSESGGELLNDHDKVHSSKRKKRTSSTYVNAITVVIFLEFFSWGLVTTILPEIFSNFFGPESKWIVLGLTQGLKGFLSFLSAPIIGSMSDSSGRKLFLLIAVASTCLPIPFLLIPNLWWHVIFVALSGISSVTFSIVFAYVSDVTTEAERSAAFGQVSATFAASLVISPALGSLLQAYAGIQTVYIVSSLIALVDVVFIIFWVPESMTSIDLGKQFDWRHASPFTSLKVVFSTSFMLQWSVIVFFSYLPEAGQYQCIIMYLQSVGFTKPDLATFIATVGILSILAQTVVLSYLSKRFSEKTTIILGLLAQIVQLALFGLFTGKITLFLIGIVLAFSSLNYPAVSALMSQNSSKEQQGAVQGMVTGIRSLCTGLGPAIFGSLFQYVETPLDGESAHGNSPLTMLPGAPFLIGCAFVFVALFVAVNVNARKRQEFPSGTSIEIASDIEDDFVNCVVSTPTSPTRLTSVVDLK
eukprot:m.46556 g.46556  ORF g.46556 m.46556 type:complete len:533 (+) comp7276_c0_seq1:62-1660(+)